MTDPADPDPEPADANLCDRCSVICFNDEELLGPFIDKDDFRILRLSYDVWDHAPDLPLLKSSADQGCEFCALLRQIIIEQAGHIGFEIHIGLFYHWKNPSFPGLGLAVLVAEVASSDASKFPVYPTFTLESDDDDARAWLKIPNIRKQQALCKENVKFMKDAIGNCLAGCHHPAVAEHLPRRLLHIEPGRLGGRIVRLIETSDYEIPPGVDGLQYAALSYCWGSVHDAETQLETTTTSLCVHKDAIDERMMPRVLRDAVEVCGLLSIRYLWIDSLCITQDDKSDWETESGAMALIYNNALLTIIAAGSASCHESLLRKPHRELRIPFASRIHPSVGGYYALSPSGVGFGPHLLRSGWPENDVLNSPWIRRGWTLQEQMMSRRQLIFGEFMIHFQCQYMVLSENGYLQYRNTMHSIDNPSIDELVKGGFGEQNELRSYQTWQDMLSKYSTRSFTVAKDRVPGISGVARLYTDRLGRPADSYLAGIWKQDLPYPLTWTVRWFGIFQDLEGVRDVAELVSPPAIYLAPSWSPLRYHGMPGGGGQQGAVYQLFLGLDTKDKSQSRSECTVQEARTVVNGLNPFGQVCDGILRLKAKFGAVPSFLFPIYCDQKKAGDWAIQQDGLILAYCVLDALVERKPQPPGELSMLVLGSSFDQGSRMPHIHDWAQGPCSTCGYSFVPNNSLANIGGLTREIGSQDVMELDGVAGSLADLSVMYGLDELEEETRRRDYWGILIHTSHVPGKYVRIGVWLSSAEDRGYTDYFTRMETQEVEII